MKRLVLIACCLLLCLWATDASAVNSVVVETKTVAAGATGVIVGVHVTNDIVIQGATVPLEIRTVSGGAFIVGGVTSPTQLWGIQTTGRINNSPLGAADASGNELWPAASITTNRYATPAGTCGPRSYGATNPTWDGISPDGAFVGTVSTGDPSFQEIYLQPGTDGPTTAEASFRFRFNINANNGCFIIDTCCTAPANHLAFVNAATQFEVPSFTPGFITVGTGDCNPPANTAPDAICQNIQVVADGNCQGTATAAQVNNGSTDAEDGTNLILALNPAGPYPLGANPVWLRVTDQGGLKDSCQATITVVDDTDPSIACPSNIAVQCAANVPAPYADGAAFTTAGGSFSDNCSGAVWSYGGQTSDGQSCPEVITRLYIVTDAAGNADTCAQTITVDDTEAPVITDCPNDTTIHLPNGTTSTVVLYSDASITDNCNNVSIIHSPLSNSSFNVGTTQVRLIASDLCGNADTCFFNVTIIEDPAENTPPTAICRNVVDSADDVCQGAVLASQVDNGSSDAETAAGNLVYTLVPPSPYTIAGSPYSVILIVTDEGGLSDTCDATITMVDVSPPAIACPPNISVQCPGDVPAPYGNKTEFVAAGGTSTDCGTTTVALFSEVSDGGSCPETRTRVYRATDAAGNFADCTQLVIVDDTIPPTVTCPNNINVTVSNGTTDTIITYSAAVANDNCDLNVAISYSTPSGSPFPVGLTVVEVIATDDCGNADTCEFSVTITEESTELVPPNALCSDVKVDADANCEADADINNGSYDPDGGSVTTSQNPAGPYPLGQTLVLLTVTDDEGDTDTCSALVTVNDVTPPVVSCPSDIDMNNDPGQCGALFIGKFVAPSATDNCDQDVTITQNPDYGAFLPVGANTITVIATDNAGNADTCSYTVTVHDIEPPVASCPGGWQQPNDPGQCGAVVDWNFNGVGSSDNCAVQSSVYTPPAGSFFPVGTTPVQHVVTDAAGNADTCNFNVTVNDTSAPVVVCSGDIKVTAQFGQSTAVVNYISSASDCGGLESFVCSPPSGFAFPIGQTTVTCTAEDVDGNITTCTFTVTVNPGSQNAPGPHVDVEQLDFKTVCACDTQTVSVYCLDVDADSCWYNAATTVPGISISPNPGWSPREVDIIACGSGLPPGTYTGWVIFHDAPGNKTDSIYVIHEVNEDIPGIDVKQDTLRFTYTGVLLNDKLCLPIDINSTGCYEQCWKLVGGSGDWVWVDPTSGQTPGSTEICVTPCAFEAGVYYHTLHFCMCPDKGDDLPPTALPFCDSVVVKLTVVDPPVLVVEPKEIHIAIDCEKKALPVPVHVTNGGGGDLYWDAWTEANWFIIEPDHGKATDTFYVSIVPDSILCPEVCDTLIDSICVYGNKGCALNSPQWVLVELIICPPDTVICDSICGYVWDCMCDYKNTCGLNAMVELWSSYPDGQILDTVTADGGAFCFDVEPGVEYDLRFWLEGYCTDTIDNWSCEDGPVSFCLKPLGFVLPESPMFHDYYSTNATFEGFPIQPGDVIYATDSNGQVVGLAYVTVPGTYLIHVLANVPKGDPDPIDEGAEFGEFVQLWLNCECPVTVNEGLVNFGSTQFDAAWDCRPTGMCCELCEGWSMFSYGIQLPDYSREAVLATIDLNYSAVRSGRCDNGPNPVISWFNDRPVNDLTTVEPWYGHDINMLQDDTLCLEGYFIPVDTEIPLCLGWNYIPYWPMEADSREHALASIAGNYDYIYNIWACGDDPSDTWVASRPVNDLYCLETCKGYWIRMTDEDTLVYPTSGYDCNEPLPKVSPSSASGQIKTSPIMADFWSNADMSTTGLNVGDIITVRSESGQLIGETVVGENGAFLVHVFGDVPNTPAVEGAQPRESLRFEVNGLAASVEGNTSFGERENNQITVRSSGANPVPNDYALLQNYPNPFNAGTVIPFTMKDASEWTLTVYNIMGQTVRTFEGFDPAGTVRVDWNGQDRNGESVPSGVYFYRVTTGAWTASKKMTLLK